VIRLTRRHALALLGMGAATALAGCTTTGPGVPTQTFESAYGQINDGGYTIPAVPIDQVPKEFRRQIVTYRTKEKPGTIIVDTRSKHLYYIMPHDRAVSYGIGVGRAGFAWEGEAYVAWKQPWPKWFPPKEMIARDPKLKKYEDGQAPGPRNPLGARALYLFDNNGKDTLYRLHGTPLWNSIGTAASSGCIRLMNQDIIDLYDRVKPGKQTKVIVIQ